MPKGIKSSLSAVLRNELRLGLVVRTVAEVAHLPPTAVDARERRSLSMAELRELLEAADGALQVLIDLCGRNGLRPAEARALRWQDVWLDAAELEVSGQMDRTNSSGPVKRAANAGRTIGLDPLTIERLERWDIQRGELEDEAGRGWSETGFVVVRRSGRPVGRETFARDLKDLCASAGIDHRLRPTSFATPRSAIRPTPGALLGRLPTGPALPRR